MHSIKKGYAAVILHISTQISHYIRDVAASPNVSMCDL